MRLLAAHYYSVQINFSGWTACTTPPLAAHPRLLSTTTIDWNLGRASLTGRDSTAGQAENSKYLEQYKNTTLSWLNCKTVQIKRFCSGTAQNC